MDFAAAQQTYAEWGCYLPSNYTTAATITASCIWLAAGTSTNSVVWGCGARAYADATTMDQAYGTAVEVTDAHTATANQVEISAATGAITIAGSPAAGQWLQIRVYRLGGGSDNLAVTASLLGVVITYT